MFFWCRLVTLEAEMTYLQTTNSSNGGLVEMFFLGCNNHKRFFIIYTPRLDIIIWMRIQSIY